MIGIYSILLGAAVVACALFLLKREFKQAYFISGQQQTRLTADAIDEEVLVHALNDVEKAMKEMSEAFYDITGDLEGNYSLHDRELQLLTERVLILETLLQGKDQELAQHKNTLDRLHKSIEKVKQPVEAIIKVEDVKQGPKGEWAYTKESDNVKNEEKSDVHIINKRTEEGDLKTQIITLRSQGHSLKRIAKMLDVGLGEIQLILNMERD